MLIIERIYNWSFFNSWKFTALDDFSSSAVAVNDRVDFGYNRDNRKEEVHFRVMRLVSDNPKITTREIADLVGISNGAAHYCITALIDKGFVKLKNFKKSNSKSKLLYQLTPKGIKKKTLLTAKFLEKKHKEFDYLKIEIKNLESELLDIVAENMKEKI